MQVLETKELAEKRSAELGSLSGFLDSVIANIPASVVVQDVRSHKILLANQQAERLFASTKMVGRFASECLRPEVADYLNQQMSQGLVQGEVRISEMPVETAEGLRTLRSRTVLNQDTYNHSDYVLYVAEDVTDELAAQRLIQVIRPPFLIDGHSCSVGVSVGIVLSPEDHDRPEQLMGYADMALYEAKRNGRNRFERFRPALDDTARQRRSMEADLRAALHLGHLKPHYQPIVSRDGNEISGYEALIRWMHPTKGLIAPMDFIPMAEETGLIHEVGSRVLNLACQDAATWGTQQKVSVNLSPVQFKNPGLLASVELALADSGLAPRRLELEITESVLLGDSDENVAILRALKGLGVAISLDDFGTGYSSLGYLGSFPFDRIKIDRSFVRDMAENKRLWRSSGPSPAWATA